MAGYPHHYETSVDVPASPAELFESIDDHERLAGHMMSSSMMMAGSRMRWAAAIGSRIRMAGAVLGFRIELEEVVTDREPPRRKTWETLGEPRLLVIGGYRMGFEIIPKSGGGSRLKIFIDWHDPPPTWRWLGKLLGRAYARWCTESMARGTANFFSRKPSQAAVAPLRYSRPPHRSPITHRRPG